MAKFNGEVRNQMSANALKKDQGDGIHVITNPNNGKIFFECGTKKGYISPKAAALIADSTSTADDFQYCECRKEGSAEWVPCLMVKSRDNEKRVL